MAIVGRTRLGAFDLGNYLAMGVISFLALYPFWYVLVVSFSTLEGYYSDNYHIIPRSFSLEPYQFALRHPDFPTAFMNSMIVMTAGVALSLSLSTLGGYVLSKQQLRGRKLLLTFVVITMFFDGGLVPFVLVVRTLKLNGTLLAYFVPRAVNAFWMILMKNYFLSLPGSLEDSAKIDGANDLTVLTRIVVPISKPIVFTIGLFYGVFFWNDFLLPMLFARGQDTWTLALFLRFMIGNISEMAFMGAELDAVVPEMGKAAFIVLALIPILAIYPFVQKYYVKGVMLGAIKE